MEWIALDVHIAGDPRVHRMATTLGRRVPEMVGYLALTFAEMAQHTPTGDVNLIPDALLASWARWDGEPTLFARQFRLELCSEDGVVRAWEKYNGHSIRKADIARERSRVWREQRTAPRPPPYANSIIRGARPGDAPYDTICVTGHDRTGQDITDTAPAGALGAAPVPASAPVPAKRSHKKKPAAADDLVAGVLEFYKAHHPMRRPGPKERDAVVKALALGYTADELREAIVGNATDEWHRARAKHELTYVLRDNGLIDDFRERGRVRAAQDDADETEPVTDGVWLTPAAERATRPRSR